nr:cytochrome P450 [Actinokineospora enzanensis]
MPVAPRGVPLLGHLPAFLRDPLAFLRSLPAYGDAVRIRLGTSSAVVVCTPELTDRVLRDDRVFDKGGPFWDRAREFAGDGVATCPHHLHRRQRRLVQPAFHFARLPGYARTMAAEFTATAGSWRDGQVLDVVAELQALTARTVAVTMFSDALPADAQRQMLDDLKILFAGMYRRMTRPPALDLLPTPGNRAYDRACARFRETLHRVVLASRANDSDQGDLLSALLSAHDPTGDASDAELTDQLTTFFIAGSETTASALSWLLHLLAERPDLQDLAHAESAAILAAGTAPDRATPVARMITEALRKWPPVWMFTRTTTTDTRIGDHTVPAGTAIIISPYLLHHRPDRHPDPERFDPDRWLPERAPRVEYIPFGSGARKCLGSQFAVTEIALGLATILTRWRLTPVDRVHAHATATLHPRPLHLTVVARSDSPVPLSGHHSTPAPPACD